MACEHNRILDVWAKCSDYCSVSYNRYEKEKHGYVPCGLNIGGGDYIEFRLCLDCGQIFGGFPITEAAVETAFGE